MNRDDEKRVREICREEIELAMKGLKREATAIVKRNAAPANNPGFSSTDRRPPTLPIDDMVDALEAQAMAPVFNDYEKRREVGMSQALAEVKAKIAQGMDLTPLNFSMPAASYFGQEDNRPGMEGRSGGVTGFFDYFMKLIEDAEDGDAATIDSAYEATCAKFNVPSMRKAGRHDKALSELPASPKGGFRLGRGDAEAEVKKPGLLGRLMGRGGSLGNADDGIDDD